MKTREKESKIMNKRNSEQGIILVLVIIVVAILTIVVADLIYFTQIDREISTNTVDEVKARYIAKSGVHVAAGTLKGQPLEDLSEIASTIASSSDYASGFWAINVPFFPVGEGTVSVTVVDERAKVNLNALVNESSNRVDQQVLAELKELFRFLEVEESKSERFIASLVNWIDRNMDGSQNDQDSSGANTGFYSGQSNPYNIKDGPLDSVYEVRLIDGMDEEFFNKVKDYVTVYPRDKKINFSTAPKVVMMAAIKASNVPAVEGQGNSDTDEISDDVAEQIADEIIAIREDEPVIGQKKARDVANTVDDTSDISAGLVGVVLNSGYSDVFSVKAVGSLGETNPTKRIIEAILLKTNENSQNKVEIISWKEL
ncbi:MAG: type II secretion system minor pseudopilin GspK [Thermodesulfobacteriota bacterium]